MDELEQIQAQIQELQKKAQEITQAKRLAVLEEVKNKIRLYGLTARELGFAAVEKAGDKRRLPVAAKYRKGENTWAGRGRKPRWLEEHIAAGGKAEDLLV